MDVAQEQDGSSPPATHVHTTQTSNCALIASSKSMTVTLLQSTAQPKLETSETTTAQLIYN